MKEWLKAEPKTMYFNGTKKLMDYWAILTEKQGDNVEK
jgi:hypothetical protein